MDSYQKISLTDIEPKKGDFNANNYKYIDSACQVGESPVWDSCRRCLFWVDIEGKLFFKLAWDDCTLERWNFGIIYEDLGRPGCFVLCKSGRLLFAFENGFALYNVESQEMVRLGKGGDEWQQDRLTERGYSVRMNDGRVDRSGRLIVGGINFTGCGGNVPWEAVQPCYAVELGTTTGSEGNIELVAVVRQLRIPLVRITNSICFSPDGHTMYHCDSSGNHIDAFEYDSAAGEVHENATGKVIVNTSHTPDGSITDLSGGLWNAEYEGGRVVRYEHADCDSSWRESLVIPVPAPQTTCPCIGGPDGDLLFVTSARNGYSAERLEKEPLAGSLFIFRLPVNESYKANEALFNDDILLTLS